MPSAQKVDPATVVRQLACVSWLRSNLDSRNHGTIRSVAAATALRDLGSVGYEPAVDELLPHLPHPGGHVDPYRRPSWWKRLRSGVAVRPALEHVEDTLRNEPAAQCQNVAIVGRRDPAISQHARRVLLYAAGALRGGGGYG